MNLLAFGRMFRNMLRHPLGRKQKSLTIMRFLRWQLGSRIICASVVMPFVENTRLLVRTGMRGATGNLYVGIQEFEDMAFLLHFLRTEDTFIDIGANVGTYTVLAGGVCQSQVIAIEPIPETYDVLLDNINLNRISMNVIAKNIGVAAHIGTLRFSATSLDPTNHVLSVDKNGNSVTIPVNTLNIIAANSSPALIKVDVEGFEQEVIQGGDQILSNNSLSALIIEFNGLGKRYGFDDNVTHLMLQEYGFFPVVYDPFERKLTEIAVPNPTGNTIYVRTSSEMKDRLQSAEPININNIVF